jgi:hypothetical protein
MPSSHWSNRLAAFLVFLAVGVAFILTLAATPEGKLHNQKNTTHQQADNGNDEQQNPTNVVGWWRVAEDYVKAEDSLAQWLMMLLGIAGVILSGLAVFWVKKTLDVTRDVGRRQTRAYAGIEKAVVIASGPTGFRIAIVLKNWGNSPMREVDRRWILCTGEPSPPGDAEEHLRAIERVPDLAPQQSMTFYAPIPKDVIDASNLPEVAPAHQVRIAGRIDYTDVFGDRHTLRLSYKTNIGDRIAEGPLHMDEQHNFAD